MHSENEIKECVEESLKKDEESKFQTKVKK